MEKKNKVEYYKSPLNFEYFWFNGMYISLQEINGEFDLNDYCMISSEQSTTNEETYKFLSEKNLITTVELEYLKKRIKWGFKIIDDKMTNI